MEAHKYSGMETQKYQRNQHTAQHDVWDDNEDDISDINSLRDSNLSRYRSCPHLVDEVKYENLPFESTADDMSRLTAKLIINRTSPSNKRKMISNINYCPGSATPTPPSTPRSRRSVLSQRDNSSTPGHGLSPASTPKLLKRRLVERTSLSRESSIDSKTGSRKSELCDGKVSAPVQLSEENLAKYDGIRGRLSNDVTTAYCQQRNETGEENDDVNKQELYGGGQYDGDDTQDKCERWLQTLNISKPNRLKSRSHIQLPPI